MPARLKLPQLPDREVCFLVLPPHHTGQSFEAIIARFIIDRKRVVLAEDDGACMSLDPAKHGRVVHIEPALKR